MPEEKPAGKSTLIIRVVLIVILIVVLIMAVGHGKLRGEYKKALGLYEEATAMEDMGDIAARTAKLQEAEGILEALVQKSMSGIKLRKPATQTLAQVKMQIAVDRGLNDRSVATYAEVVRMLQEAQKLDPGSQEIGLRLQEYQGYLDKAPATPEE